jgi:methylmalonyl-CoA mutase cobalamin-binding domain/chain
MSAAAAALTEFALALQEIARGSMSLAGAVAMQSLMGTKFLHLLGNADIIERLFKPALRGEKIGAICMTEPNAGSDLDSIATTAKKVEGGYVINGQKTWITSAPVADFFTVFARAGEEKKLTIFLVEKDFKGLIVGREIHKMGVWALPTSEVAFDECFVPDSHRLSKEEGDGEGHLRKTLGEIRIITGAMGLGVAHAALAEAVRYAGERKQFGKPINRYQAIQMKLAEMATELEAAEHLVYYAAWRRDAGKPLSQGSGDGQAVRHRDGGQGLRPGRPRLRLLRLRHGIPGATLPARRALHADRRRHQRNSQTHHCQGSIRMTDRTRPIKILLGKPGLDGHDQGAKVVARAMMDAGFEVIYTGLRQTPEQIARIALEEDVDVISLSSMAGSHIPFCRKLKPLLEEAGLTDKLWVIGGNLPAQDHDALRELGFKGIFPSGSKLDAITEYIRKEVK